MFFISVGVSLHVLVHVLVQLQITVAFVASLPYKPYKKSHLRGDVSKNETLLYQMGVHFKR